MAALSRPVSLRPKPPSTKSANRRHWPSRRNPIFATGSGRLASGAPDFQGLDGLVGLLSRPTPIHMVFRPQAGRRDRPR